MTYCGMVDCTTRSLQSHAFKQSLSVLIGDDAVDLVFDLDSQILQNPAITLYKKIYQYQQDDQTIYVERFFARYNDLHLLIMMRYRSTIHYSPYLLFPKNISLLYKNYRIGDVQMYLQDPIYVVLMDYHTKHFPQDQEIRQAYQPPIIVRGAIHPSSLQYDLEALCQKLKDYESSEFTKDPQFINDEPIRSQIARDLEDLYPWDDASVFKADQDWQTTEESKEIKSDNVLDLWINAFSDDDIRKAQHVNPIEALEVFDTMSQWLFTDFRISLESSKVDQKTYTQQTASWIDRFVFHQVTQKFSPIDTLFIAKLRELFKALGAPDKDHVIIDLFKSFNEDYLIHATLSDVESSDKYFLSIYLHGPIMALMSYSLCISHTEMRETGVWK